MFRKALYRRCFDAKKETTGRGIFWCTAMIHTQTKSQQAAAVELSRALLRQAGIEVKHSMAGRLRLRIRALRSQPRRIAWLHQQVQHLHGVQAVEGRAPSGSLIGRYSQTSAGISSRSLLARVYGLVQELRAIHPQDLPTLASAGIAENIASKDAGACAGSACSICQSSTGCPADAASSAGKAAFRRAFWLSGVMLYAGLRTWIFRLPLLQSPFSLIGLAASLGAWSLSREAVRELGQCPRMTVKPLLAAGAWLSVAMGQSFSALQILWMYNLAEASEEYINRSSRKAISKLLELTPTTAFIMRQGMEVEVQVEEIQPGDVVAVHAGERMPVDGQVLDGEALLDESSINGRSEFQLKRRGNQVYAGTMLSQGVLIVKTTRTGGDTYMARIVRMVDEALAQKAPVEHKADQLASRLMKIGTAATMATWFLTFDPLRTLTVLLVMSCPCATVLAASSAVTAALANAARRSILIKGGLHLEQIGKANLFCFDKTGTLTQETPQVMSVHSRVPSISRQRLLAMAATAESHNQHPLAQAIIAAARAEGAPVKPHAICEFMVGRGVLCTVGGDAVILVGNSRFMDEQEVDITWFRQRAAQEREQGHTVVYIAKNGSAIGMLGIANPVRPEALATLQALRADGVQELSLITGDTQASAESLMLHFPFDECRAELLPEDKAARVDELRQRGVVVMVGDGVNDALALARADIGIAMGSAGAEAAIEAADIALADSNLEGLLALRRLSHQTMRIIEQNHVLAVSTDLIGTVLAMMGRLHPLLAGMIHILHTGGILLNSSRLLVWESATLPGAQQVLPGLAVKQAEQETLAELAQPGRDNEAENTVLLLPLTEQG